MVGWIFAVWIHSGSVARTDWLCDFWKGVADSGRLGAVRVLVIRVYFMTCHTVEGNNGKPQSV